MSNDVFDQDGMIVDIDAYIDGVDDEWDDRYECGCCMCCGCSCAWDIEDEEDELPSDLQE